MRSAHEPSKEYPCMQCEECGLIIIIAEFEEEGEGRTAGAYA